MEWKISENPVPYEDALAFMDERVAAIAAGEAEECVWLLEHPPLYTAGTSAKEADLLAADFPVYKTGRGGQYTYHGPGQRIAYVMIDLKKRAKEKAQRKCHPERSEGSQAAKGDPSVAMLPQDDIKAMPDVKKYVCDLEEWIIRSVGAFGIKGERREGRIGIWVSQNDTLSLNPSPLREREGVRSEQGEGGFQDKKIAAIGVRIRRWVTLHGIAINVNPDLSHFGGIVPCGITDAGVTSFADLGVQADMAEVDKALQEKWAEVFAA